MAQTTPPEVAEQPEVEPGAPATQPMAFAVYEELAEAYSAKAETKGHNAYYDHPAVQSLLPDLAGAQVLDSGCGPGIYAAWMLDRGAEVTGLDMSPTMLRLARTRVGDRARLIRANLEEPLDFLTDSSFDGVVSPLVLDYIQDWRPLFSEYYRVLRAGGWFVFSCGHPFGDFQYFKTDNYFVTERVSSVWSGFGIEVTMPSYRRPLQAIMDPLLSTGFQLDKLLEPRPVPAFKESQPDHYEALMRFPGFICLRARKPQ